MQFLVLGPLEVRDGDKALGIRAGRPRTLLHLMLLHRQAPLPVELIADRLWGDQLPTDDANAVHQLVSYLRRSLGSRELIVRTAGGYRLDIADEDLDAVRFEGLVHAASAVAGSSSHAGSVAALGHAEHALRLWRGEPFAESAAYEWAGPDIARLRDAYQLAQEYRLEAMLVVGRHNEVVLEAQSLAAAYPLHEHFHAQRVRALYRSGRQGEALEVLRDVRTLLADELGIDPGRELQELEGQVLRQDAALEWSPSVDQPAVVLSSAPVDEPVVRPARHTLPSPGLVLGRQWDLDTTTPCLKPGALLTLTGPGGVGKTHLALALAAVTDLPQAWLVDLGDVDRVGFVAATVADRLGLTGPTPSDPGDRVVEALSGYSGLLVLDTCEHVRSGVVDLLGRLRDAAPDLTVLATSRRPLGIADEVVHQLAPLAEPAAVDLFRHSARRVKADFELTDKNTRDVIAIVSALDRLPLAIELAATQVDVLAPALVRARLNDQLDTLVSADPKAPARHRSLRAAIHSSVVLLSDEERSFLWLLCVFSGSFDVPAALAVSGGAEPDVYGLLGSLVRQSLVARDRESNFRLLSPIRAYALDHVTDFAAVRRRHADWVAEASTGAADEMRGADQERALAELRGHLPDARAALAWALEERYVSGAARIAVSFSWLWTLQGLADEGIGWLTRVRTLLAEDSVSADVDALLGASVLRSLGLLANPVGQLELARDACAEAAVLSREAGDDLGAAAALLTLGVSEWAMGDLEAAAAAHDEAARLASESPTGWHLTAATVLRARTALDAAEPDAAARIHGAIALAQAANERQLLGLALACQARYLRHQGNPAAAIIVANEALRVWRQIDYLEGEMSALNILSRSLAETGEYDEAQLSCTRALHLARTARHPGGQCETVESMALLAAAAGKREHAYLLLCASARERARLGAAVPLADRAALAAVEATLQDALASASHLVEAQASVLRFQDLVERLVSQVPIGMS